MVKCVSENIVIATADSPTWLTCLFERYPKGEIKPMVEEQPVVEGTQTL